MLEQQSSRCTGRRKPSTALKLEMPATKTLPRNRSHEYPYEVGTLHQSRSQLHPEGEGRLLHAPRVRTAVQAVRTPDTILPDNIFKDGVPDLTTYGN